MPTAIPIPISQPRPNVSGDDPSAYLEGGDRLHRFVEDFPDVTREHAIAVLRASKAALLFSLIERQGYEASLEELAAIQEALGQIK